MFAERWKMEIFSTLKIIVGSERGLSELSFAYSLYNVLFRICSTMATDRLENFQA